MRYQMKNWKKTNAFVYNICYMYSTLGMKSLFFIAAIFDA